MRQISLLHGPKGGSRSIRSVPDRRILRACGSSQRFAEERGEPLEKGWQTYLDKTSLERLPTIDEVAWAVEMLLAPQADAMHGGVLYSMRAVTRASDKRYS